MQLSGELAHWPHKEVGPVFCPHARAGFLGCWWRDRDDEKIRAAGSEKSYPPQGKKSAPVAEAFILLHKGKTGHMLERNYCQGFALSFN